MGPARQLHVRLHDEGGLTLVEVMVAVLVLTVGILALVSSFGAAQRLTLNAERRASLTHRAQREIERLEAVSYNELAMTSAPAHSSEESNPDFYVDYHSPVKCNEAVVNGVKGGCYAWNSEAVAEEEPLVIAEATTGKACSEEEVVGCGEVSPTPTAWSDGNVSGEVYAFVTWQTDGSSAKPYCGEGCPTENDYKRLTVVVTVNVAASSHQVAPVKASTLIANPSAAAGEGTANNPLTSPGTTCGGELCTKAISVNATSWYLHDSPADAVEEKPTAPTGSHATHPTVFPEKPTSCEGSNHSGCPKPDLMDETPPTATTLYDYSTDQDALGSTVALTSSGACAGELRSSICYGGRALPKNAECNESEPGGPNPSASNAANEMWVSKPLASATTLTTAGGMVLYTQTVGGLKPLEHGETLCIAIYEVPKNIEDLWLEPATTPTLIAYTHYTPAIWPTSLKQLRFTFELAFVATEHTIAEHDRIGLRVWTSAASTYGLTLAYDTAGDAETEIAGYPAILQLDTQ